MTQVILSVSKTWWRRGVNSHRKGSKRIWMVYFLEGDTIQDAKLHSKVIPWWKVAHYKSQIRRKRKAICPECQSIFINFYKNDKELMKEECTVCDDGTKLVPYDAAGQLEKVLRDLQS